MHLKHFGDSYDIVKKMLLQWLAEFGPWAAHPMFTHEISDSEAKAFSNFLGAPLVSTQVLTHASDRATYLAGCGNCRSIFLDPDTGVRLHRRERQRSSEFVFADELIEIANLRPTGLTLVFDQSLARGGEREGIQEKLNHFSNHDLSGFAYVSHACFLVIGQSIGLVDVARRQLLTASGLPESRILAPGVGAEEYRCGSVPR